MACINLNFDVNVNKCLGGLWASLPLCRPKSGIKKLEKTMARLRGKRDDIKIQIDQAEREGKIPTNEASLWLREVEELEGQVAAIKQDFQSMSCFSCNCFNQTGGTSSQTQQAGDQVSVVRESSNYCSVIRRVAKKLDEANELMSRTGALDPIATVGPPEPTMMLSISDRPPVGIDSYVEEIVGYVNSGEDNIIGIYGMGGVGKTTILNRIQQHYLPNHTIFDRVIWAVASKDCQLKRLQKDIARSLDLNTLQESYDERTCGEKLFNYLKDKKCLLFLDDIWEHLDLRLLGMAHSATEQGQQQPQPRKVVIFTTRSETVCAQMNAKKDIRVKCLDSVQAWQLFEENSNRDVLSSDAGINHVAQELVEECGGLPLALITIAKAMLEKKTWEVWNDALNQIRDKHKWTNVCSPENLPMYKAFKLSYDNLENDSIRECLLCCALWPEDYVIHKFFELIPCWIGCGIICEFNVINEAFAKGCSHLEALMAASLLEKCSDTYFPYMDTGVKLHDVIRDMALLMVSGLEENKRQWIVKAGIGLRDLPRQEEWKQVERASFMMNNITSLQEYGASTFPKLSMLILNSTYCFTIPLSLFTSMPHLTYLDLSGCRIAKLPKEICSLTELRYLNLSKNPITRLPAEFACLGKLEYLLLRNTGLEIVPNGTISNLSMLKWLDISHIDPAPEWWCDELKCFKGHHRLSVGIDINATRDNIEYLDMLPNVSLWKLTLYRHEISKLPNYDLGTPQWGCRVGDKLEFLCIMNLGLDRLVLAAGMGGQLSFGCLKTLKFCFLELLEEISLNRVPLYNLRELYISYCPMLKDVSWVLQLPCLHILNISDCLKMKELITDVGNSNSSSSIQKLRLAHMPNLNCIANRPLYFPYLEYMHVIRCPGLKNLSFGVEILNNRLKKIEGDRDWWNNLDWDDQSIKDSLTPYFRYRPY